MKHGFGLFSHPEHRIQWWIVYRNKIPTPAAFNLDNPKSNPSLKKKIAKPLNCNHNISSTTKYREYSSKFNRVRQAWGVCHN